MDDYLSKPIQLDHRSRVLDKWLGQSQLSTIDS
jgi:hypothetical protein